MARWLTTTVPQGQKMYCSWSKGHGFEPHPWLNLGCLVFVSRSSTFNVNTIQNTKVNKYFL